MSGGHQMFNKKFSFVYFSSWILVEVSVDTAGSQLRFYKAEDTQKSCSLPALLPESWCWPSHSLSSLHNTTDVPAGDTRSVAAACSGTKQGRRGRPSAVGTGSDFTSKSCGAWALGVLSMPECRPRADWVLLLGWGSHATSIFRGQNPWTGCQSNTVIEAG